MAQTFEDSHFKWTDQYRGDTSLRDCDELIGKIDDCLRDNPGYMEIEAVLFKAFLFVAHWRKPKCRNSKEAKKYLDIAFNKIKECQNADARNGYSIVRYTLLWQIERNQELDSRADKYGNRISAINKTPECNAFIDATRAFALSFLGIGRVEESLRYYLQAQWVCPTNIDWLYGFADCLGKKGRREVDKEALEEEAHICERILAIDPTHISAMVLLAQNRFHQRSERPQVIHRMFNKALALAQGDGHRHTKVAVRVARYFRMRFDFKQSLDILNDAEHSIGKDPNEMLFHQKAMVYLIKYKRYENLTGFPKEYLLAGEEEGDKKSLLKECLIHLDEAIKRGDSRGNFNSDRAYVYEQLGMHDEARDEYIKVIVASNDFITRDRCCLYVKYGLFLERRGNVELMMNYLSKGIELFKSKIYAYSNSIDDDIYSAISVYDSTNAGKCSSNTSNVRAEAWYRLGWLRLLFSDVTLDKLQESVLSKNNSTGKTHLQLYEQAYDEIENNIHNDPTPCLLSDIIEGLIICHLREGRKENLSKVEALIDQRDYIVDGASQKLADLKLAQCEQQSSENEHPRLLSEAVQEGSLDACERLCKWFESKTCPSSDPDVLRYCVQIKICLSRDELLYRQYNILGGRGLLLHTLVKTADLNDSEIDRKEAVRSSSEFILKRKGGELDKLRVEYLRLLESREANSGEADLIEHCAEVICKARFALAYAVSSFQRRWYPPKHDKKEMEFSFFKAAPTIKEKKETKGGQTIVTPLKEAVQKVLKNRLEGRADEKRWQMPEFSQRFPDLFEYLTSIQPAANPDGSYDWLCAVHDLTNKHKHREPLSQMEYTMSVGKDVNGDIRRTFNIEALAQTARFGVEKIVTEFRNADDRLALRFAEKKCLRINRYALAMA